MSNVKHQRIWQILEVGMSDDKFLDEMHNGLMNLIGTADAIEFHVDWSTLRIEEEDSIAVLDASGERTEYGRGLRMTVDTIRVEEGSE